MKMKNQFEQVILFFNWCIGVHFVKGVLMQKIFTDAFGCFQGHSVSGADGFRSHQPNNFHQFRFFLQKDHRLPRHLDKLTPFLFVFEGVRQILLVEGITCQPVNSRKVPLLSQPGQQRPENLHHMQRGLNHRIRQIAAGRTDRPDNGKRPFPLGTAGTDDPTGPFIEGGNPCPKISRIPFFGRHFFQTRRDFPHCLRPSARTVGHQGH